MKKTESNNLAEKTIIHEKSKENAVHSLNVKNQNHDQEKTQGTLKELVESELHRLNIEEKDRIVDKYRKSIEEAEIVNKSEIMDEIIKNNDKFETIRVLMEILCKELGISVESQFGEIHKALVGVTERYYKSMEDWRNLTKMGKNNDIRQ